MSVIQVKKNLDIERYNFGMYSIGNMRDARNRMEEIDKLVGPRNLIYQLSFRVLLGMDNTPLRASLLLLLIMIFKRDPLNISFLSLQKLQGPDLQQKDCLKMDLSRNLPSYKYSHSPIMLLIGDNLTLSTPDYAVDEVAEDKGNAPALTARIQVNNKAVDGVSGENLKDVENKDGDEE
ncbi:hypothetical protein Tco_0064105 [Tanacetum coccineum]